METDGFVLRSIATATDHILKEKEKLIKALKMIDECLEAGIPIEKGDPIHIQIKKLLA
jgi:hypothetical protein